MKNITKEESFRVTTFMGTFLIILAMLGWISTVQSAMRNEPTLTVLYEVCSLFLTVIAIKFFLVVSKGKEIIQKPCKKCGEIITYYWVFGIYVGRHIYCHKKE